MFKTKNRISSKAAVLMNGSPAVLLLLYLTPAIPANKKAEIRIDISRIGFIFI